MIAEVRLDGKAMVLKKPLSTARLLDRIRQGRARGASLFHQSPQRVAR
jgi:hypothetical protein